MVLLSSPFYSKETIYLLINCVAVEENICIAAGLNKAVITLITVIKNKVKVGFNTKLCWKSLSPWSQVRSRPEAERRLSDFFFPKNLWCKNYILWAHWYRIPPGTCLALPIPVSGLLKLNPILATTLAYANTYMDLRHSCKPFQACPSLYLCESRSPQNKTFTYTLSGELIR